MSGSEQFYKFKRRAVTGESKKDLHCLLNKKRRRREEEGREKRGEDFERGQGVTRVVTRYHS